MTDEIVDIPEQPAVGRRRRFTQEQERALLADAALPGGSI